MSKYSHINPTIVSYIRELGKKKLRILDIGCWDGTLGYILKKENSSIRIDGVDINQSALEVAKKHGYSKLYNLDLNDNNLNKIKDKYDLIVLGDVLEHLINPENLLAVIRIKLTRNGIAIVSLPNIAFIKYRLLHLIGRWSYTESGIMDKTHLKFYTLKTMKEMFEKNKFSILKYRGYSAVPNIFWIVKKLGKYWPTLFALQIVFKIKPMNNI